MLYVRDRWAGWLFMTVLAAGALFSARIALQSKPFDVRAPIGPSLKHEPDFEATRLDAWRTSVDGASRTRIIADKVVHYRDDLSSTYTMPRLSVTTQTTYTALQANAAAARNDGEEFVLQGNVQLKRNGLSGTTIPAQLAAQSLTFYPDSGIATSRSPSVLTQGLRTVTASGGFDYRNPEAEITLLGPVRSTVQPPKK